jgi:prepilin-type N-terminal cleavage/methylation domain-containing protein
MRIKKKCKAFTLVELLIVIVIIGILAGLIIWALRSAVVKARDARAKNSVKVVQDALELYMSDNPDLTESELITSRRCGVGRWCNTQSATLVRIKDISGQQLITDEPKDGQNGVVQIKIIGSSSYAVAARSATDKSKCWVTSGGTSDSALLSNLDDTSPSACPF